LPNDVQGYFNVLSGMPGSGLLWPGISGLSPNRTPSVMLYKDLPTETARPDATWRNVGYISKFRIPERTKRQEGTTKVGKRIEYTKPATKHIYLNFG
jgi:hypothetical protein